MGTLTLDDQYLSSTLQVFLKKEHISLIDYELPFLAEQEAIHGKGKPSKEGGPKVLIPFESEEHSDTTQLSNGYEPINLSVRAIGKNGEEDWMDCIRPVVISNHEMRLNRGSESKVIDLLELRTRNTLAGLRRQLHKRIWGVANSGLTDLNTLNGFDFATAFLESAAFGSQSSVVHNISKATYNTTFWQNQRADGAGSFSANGLIGLDHIGIQARSIRDRGSKNQVWYASTSAIGHLKRAHRSNEQYVGDKEDGMGALILTYDGKRIRINRDMPANSGLTTATDPWSMALIDHDAIYFLSQAGEYFRAGDMKELSGFDCKAAPLHLMGQLVTEWLASSGVLFDAETW